MAQMKPTIPLSLRGPLRPLDWRWQLAQQVCRGRQRAPSTLTAPWLQQVVRYCLARSGRGHHDDRRHFKHRFAGLNTARALALGKAPQKAHVEAWLLTGAKTADVAKATGFPPQVIAWYEWLFFDVYNRLPNKDWIIASAVMPPPTAFRDRTGRVGVALRQFAYFQGPTMIELLWPAIMDGRVQALVENRPDANPRDLSDAEFLLLSAAVPLSAIGLPVWFSLSERSTEMVRLRCMRTEAEQILAGGFGDALLRDLGRGNIVPPDVFNDEPSTVKAELEEGLVA